MKKNFRSVPETDHPYTLNRKKKPPIPLPSSYTYLFPFSAFWNFLHQKENTHSFLSLVHFFSSLISIFHIYSTPGSDEKIETYGSLGFCLFLLFHFNAYLSLIFCFDTLKISFFLDLRSTPSLIFAWFKVLGFEN